MKRKRSKAERAEDPAPDDLRAYRKKRDPGKTVEPFSPDRVVPVDETTAGRYVVHLHDATRRHYDLRLQIGSALASFAVPRGPSLDPADKRLAVQTEAHPIEYLHFEDVIPEGNYGAGPMIVWDLGRVRYLETSAEEGLRRGDLKFELAGHKLRGRYALVETSRRQGGTRGNEKPQWLLIKKEDAFSKSGYAVADEQPRSILSGLTVEELFDKESVVESIDRVVAELDPPVGEVETTRLVPMLCSLTEASLEQPGFIYELKLDGVRIVADKKGDEVALRYRTLRPATATYPEITRAVRALAPARIVLDGEIVAFDHDGKPNFHRLARRIHARRPYDVQRAEAEVPVTYVVFDILAVGDRDLGELALTDRKRILQRVVPGTGLVRVLDHIEGDGTTLWSFCEENELEGVVAKRASMRYVPGPTRTGEWVKIKRDRTEDFVIVSWLSGRGSQDDIGSFDVASHAGDRLVLRGAVGSGLDDKTIRLLKPRLDEIETAESAAEGSFVRPSARRHHVQPRLVARIQFAGWTDDGHLRHPVFLGIREDVDASACDAAPPDELLEREIEVVDEPPRPDWAGDARARVLRATSTAPRVKLTNQTKVFWPEEGFTKGDLCNFYAAISDSLLPFLKERPVMLVRYPDGIDGKSFYQWNSPRGTPDWLRTFKVRSEEHDGKDVGVFIVDSADALVHIANLGCIPLHVLACRAGSLEECDFLTIDFDLSEQPFKHAVSLARTLHELLGEIGLSGYPKTSGQTGLHVLIPLGPGVPWDAAKILVELIGRMILLKHEDIASMERRVEARGGKVYIDTGQTGRSRTIVAPYSVRAYPGARVSTPLTWDEVHIALDPARFTMFTVPERVAEIGDPLATIFEHRPDIATAVKRLEQKVRPT